MFDTFARLLSSIPTFLFPLFASYKALKTSDPALLTPWLMYWVVLACSLFFESWAIFILDWVPFYSWIRLCFLLYLILPQTQGATFIYQTHIHPFLETNEYAIDEFISSAHDRAKIAGLRYLKHIIEFVKQKILGFPPKEPTPPSTPTKLGYTQSLMARFKLPTPRPLSGSPMGSATSSITDFYSLLASAVNAATSRDPFPRSFTRHLSQDTSSAERLSFISAQRERLVILLSALEKEANDLEADIGTTISTKIEGMRGGDSDSDEISERTRGSLGGLAKSHSEPDFEKIEAELTAEELKISRQEPVSFSNTGSWLPWNWHTQTETAEKSVGSTVDEVVDDKGKSSGVDL